MAETRGLLGDSWAFTEALGNGVWDAGTGMVEGLGDLAKGGYGKSVMENPGKAYQDARDGALAAYDRFEQAKDLATAEGRSAEFFGDMAGGALFEVGSILVPVGLAAKAGRVASIADDVADAAKAARNIENAEDVLGATQKVKGVSVNPAIKEFDDKVSPVQKCPVNDCDVGVKNVPLSQARIDEIIATPKGKRPPPSEYLSQEYIKQHLAKFDKGSARIVSKKAMEKFGTAGPDPSFVMPKSYVDQVVKNANGDIGKIEDALGFPKGSLDPNDMMVAEIAPTKKIKIPSGNEDGANVLWEPGGLTSGGVIEAVMNLPPVSELTLKPLIRE